MKAYSVARSLLVLLAASTYLGLALSTHAADAAPASDPAELRPLLAKGRSQYLAGDAVAAQQTFLQAAERDPANREAKDFLSRIAQDEARTAAPVREQTRNRLMEEVARSWQRPSVIPAQGPGAEITTVLTPTEGKLNDIVLPNVSFTRVPIGQVVAALSAASEEFDVTDRLPKGVNIVLLDPENRTPAVTLTLHHVTLRRVLDFVAEAIGYQYEIQADAIVFRPGGETSSLETDFFPVTRATVMRMAGLSEPALPGLPTGRHAGSPGGRAGDEPVAGQNSRSGEAAAMKAFLQQAGVNFEAVTGASLAYDGSAIIVTQTSRNLGCIRNILVRYREVRQVEIEAKFMEVQDGVLDELGVNWLATTKTTQLNAGAHAAYTTGNRTLASAFANRSSGQQGSIIRPEGMTVADDGSVTSSPGLNLPIVNNAPQFPGATDVGLSASPLAVVSGVIGEFDVNAVVRALSQQQGTDLLSAPKVTVLSGNPATITVAQEMRYPQSFGQTQSQVGTGSANGGGSAGVAITAGTPQEFTSRNVGVELRVTPTVEEDGTSISLDLNPKVTEFDGFVEFGGPSIAISGGTTVTVPSGFFQPIFSVRDISTKVTIWDGATLVMGGLTREEVKKVNDKVPFLGDLPLLGRLFRSTGQSAQKRNLLIFVTANLVNPGGAPTKQRLRALSGDALFPNPALVKPTHSEPPR